jgi:uncharacterized membrane protein YphA (DoxX/SURF4 family)
MTVLNCSRYNHASDGERCNALGQDTAITVFAVCAALGESVCAFSVSCELFTRMMSAVVTATIVVAIYCSIKVGTAVESASLYAIPFAALTLTGPGQFSLDQLVERYSAFRRLPIVKL